MRIRVTSGKPKSRRGVLISAYHSSSDIAPAHHFRRPHPRPGSPAEAQSGRLTLPLKRIGRAGSDSVTRPRKTANSSIVPSAGIQPFKGLTAHFCFPLSAFSFQISLLTPNHRLFILVNSKWLGLATGVTPAVSMACRTFFDITVRRDGRLGYTPPRRGVTKARNRKPRGRGRKAALRQPVPQPNSSANVKSSGGHLECAGRARAATALSGTGADEPSAPSPASTSSRVALRLPPPSKLVRPVRPSHPVRANRA